MPFQFLTRQQLENSPSRLDGISLEQENRRRRLLVRFLKGSVQRLKLPSWVADTAAQICLRFYTRKSYAKNDAFTIGAASLFLACKIESSPRALQDVVVLCYHQKHGKNKREMDRLSQDKTLENICADVGRAEMAILFTLGFDFNYIQAGKFVLKALEELGLLHDAHKGLYQMAYNCCNDSLETTIPLEYPSKHIAIGALHAAMSHFKVQPLPAGESVGAHFGVDQGVVQEIAARLMEMYVYANGPFANGPQGGAAAAAAAAPPAPAAPADVATPAPAAPAAPAAEPLVFNLNVQHADANTETYTVRVMRSGPSQQLPPPAAVAASVVTVINQAAGHVQQQQVQKQVQREAVKAPISPEAAAESERSGKKRMSPSSSRSPPVVKEEEEEAAAAAAAAGEEREVKRVAVAAPASPARQ